MANSSDSAGAARNRLYLLDDGVINARASMVGEITVPYSGEMLITLDDAPFGVEVAGKKLHGHFFVVMPGTAHTIDAPAGRYVCIRVVPLHPNFRQFAAMRPPGIAALSRSVLAPF